MKVRASVKKRTADSKIVRRKEIQTTSGIKLLILQIKTVNQIWQ